MFSFVPKDAKYFTLLREMASRVKFGSDIFLKIFQDYRQHASYAEHIKQIEIECDGLAAKITQRLNSSFITPFDREDIYLLVTELDDVIDMINSLSRKFEIYNVTSLRSESVEVAGILNQCTGEIQGAFEKLENKKGIEEHCHRINLLEKDADNLYRTAIRRLFIEEKDPMEVVKWMAIFESLENSVDRCKDLAEQLEAVVVKNK